MKILVTGGTGYIGEHFVPELLKKGHHVRLLVRNIEKARKIFGDSCEYFVADITKENELKGCCEGIDIVYHMVAKVGNELPSPETLEEFRKVNVQGTKNIVKECKKSKIKKFIYVSSIAAMGIVKEKIISENSKCDPYLPYQISKYEAEKFLENEYIENGFPQICVRPTKVYGIGEHEYSFLMYTKLCKKGIFFKIGKGNNYISNIYISDFVQALIKLLDNGKIGETYILSSKQSISLLEIGKVISNVLNKKIFIISIPASIMLFFATIEEKIFIKMGKKPIVTRKNIESIIVDRIYDLNKAKEDLEFENLVTMEDGIKNVVKWYIKTNKV